MSAYTPITMQANGNSPPLAVEPPQNMIWQVQPSYNLGLIATVSPGASLTYTVQITGDQIPSANGNWNNHDVLASQTASANGNVGYPLTGVRLVVSNYVSGKVTLGVAQWP